MRASRRERGVGWPVVQAAGRPPTVEAEGKARAERTKNMEYMLVTRAANAPATCTAAAHVRSAASLS